MNENEPIQCRMPVSFDLPADGGAPAEFMYMPGGRHTISAFRVGKPITITVQVDRNTPAALNGSIQAHLAKSPHKPFFDFHHEGAEASAWPVIFNWKDAPQPGVYCQAEWSKPGAEAIQGKAYRGFSPEFHLDKYIDDPKNPARVIGTPLCMGSLVNNPAFKSISPLWAMDASAAADSAAQPADVAGEEVSVTQERKLVTPIMNPNTQAVAATAATDNPEVIDLRKQLETANAAIKARNARDAKDAVKAAVARGALHAQDEAVQAKWAEKLEEDPSMLVMLAALPGTPAVTAGRITTAAVQASGITITKEDPSSAVRAYESEPDANKRGGIYLKELKPIIEAGGIPPVQAANAPGTLVGSIISQRVLELLTLQLPALSRISTDFSDEQVKYGQPVISRYLGIPTVAAYNTGTGYAAADQTATDVTVTINQHKSVQQVFTANDLAGTSRRLFDEFAPACAYALAKDLIDYAYALILIAQFTNATTKVLASFTRSDVVDMGSALSGRGVPQGSAFRTLLLSSGGFAALAKDSTIITLAAYQQPGVITEGQLPNVHGFQVIEAPNLPSTGTLYGFGMSKSALVVATRLPNDYASVLPGASYGSVQTVTDPNTGASCVQTSYVDHKLGTANFRLAWMYGSAVGQPNAGQILKTT